MLRSFLILGMALTAASQVGDAQATVRVEPPNLREFRPMPEKTGKSAIRDYMQAWQSFGSALDQNRADLLEPDFVGTAKDELTETIKQQVALGIRTRYQDRAHDIQIVFYSPEGLSVELTDNVEYDVELLDHGKIKTAQHVSARYVIVLTPGELRWRVRVFQAIPQ